MRDGLHAIEFLELLDSQLDHPRPDVVWLNLNLPKIGGEEVLKRVRMSPKCQGRESADHQFVGCSGGPGAHDATGGKRLFPQTVGLGTIHASRH